MTAAATKSAVTIHLSASLLAALDGHARKKWSSLSREEGIARILADWASEKGLLADPLDEDGLEPAELNASNDG